MEAARFPKGPAHTGLTILDRLPKKKKNTLKATQLTSYMNFRMIQTVISILKRELFFIIYTLSKSPIHLSYTTVINQEILEICVL